MELFKQTLFLAFILLIPILSHAQNSPDDYVNAHNGVRAEVGSPCLAWNETLTSYAQSYVQSRLSDCALMLSNSLTYGENLFIGTGANFNAVDAVNAWATLCNKGGNWLLFLRKPLPWQILQQPQPQGYEDQQDPELIPFRCIQIHFQ